MQYDVAVIGGGHNGLTCAAYLARAGKKVVVLEERPIVGGFCTTEETVPEAPGFRFSPTSLDILTGNIPPSVIDELELEEKFGLKSWWPDPFYNYIHPTGNSFSFWRDYRRTCDEIARFSPNDAKAYAWLTEVMRDVWYVAAPYLMDHPTRPGWRTIWTTIRRAWQCRKHLVQSARILLSPPGSIIEELFETEELRAAFGNLALGGLRELHEPMSGLIMSIMPLQHGWGVRRPVGGQSGLVEALAACVRAHGGEVRCNARVASLASDAGRVTGVVLADGEVIAARNVMGAIDPVTLFTGLAPPSLVPEKTAKELRALGVYGNNASAFRADIVLSRPLELIVGPERSRLMQIGTILLAPDLDFARRAATRSVLGEITADLPIWMAVPSVGDRTLVPEGSAGDGIYVYVPIVPYELRDGRTWDEIKPRVLEDVIDVLERYAPGIRGSIVGAVGRSPQDFKRYSNVHKGNMYHSDMTIGQMGPWRPTPSLAGYRSPIPGLWHTGAGSHPMGTICGWSGRSAARALLESGG